MNKFKLTKWGAKRLLDYYPNISDWGSDQYDERKYNPILSAILEKTVKTGYLEIPKEYPETIDILEMDMRSGLEMDEMDPEEISSWCENDGAKWQKEIGCSKTTMLKTIDQYQDIIKEFSKNGNHPIQFKKPTDRI